MLMRFCLPLNSFPIWNVADCQTFDLKEVDKKRCDGTEYSTAHISPTQNLKDK